MRQSALLVLPSRAESFGAVLVEALACGTPVLATRCGGPEDIVTETVGLLVSVNNAAALAEGMERILSRRQRYCPARLRAYALERFSWEQIAEETVNLYHETVAGYRARRAPQSKTPPLCTPV
jgi:glycosyltransferase involved in cell wall biosynthesis